VPSWTAEIGSSGLQQVGRYIQHDFIPRLNGPNGMRVFEEMRSNDALIGGITLALTSAIRGVEWTITPKDKTRAAIKTADWVKRELLDLTETPLPEVMAQAADKMVYGCVPHEIVLTRRDDGSIGLRKMAFRPPETIEEWEYDAKDRITGAWQQTYGLKSRAFLPLPKLLLFRTVTREDRPMGISLLRSAYKYYVRKNALEEAEGRVGLRAGGVVVFHVPKAWLLPTASAGERALVAAYEQAAKDLAEDRKGWLILPGDVDPVTKEAYVKLSYLTADGTRPVDLQPTIERMEARIAMSVLAQFILLGSGKTGSWALAENQTTFFDRSILGMLQLDKSEINRRLLPRLWALNGFDPELMPMVDHGPLTVDLEKVTTFITSLVGAGVFASSPELRQHLAKLGHVPQPEDLETPEGEGGAGKKRTNRTADDDPDEDPANEDER
jgi:hypothetical protein